MVEARAERRRTTLRLPAALAEAVEEAAAVEGMAINTWLSMAAAFALEYRGLWEDWRAGEKARARRARLAERKR